LVSEICLGICAWPSPRFLRRVAAHLLTRADVVEVSRQESERRMKVWLDEFGLDADPSRTDQTVRVPQLCRDEVKAS
jgi:hypothetical protein